MSVMDHVALRTPHKTDEINLMEVAQKLLTRWRIILFCVALTSLAGLLTLRLATYTYTAELKITPVQSTQNATALRRQLGGLASLAGLSLPNNQEETPFFLYVESVASRAVADDLAKNTDLMKVIFKAEWDQEANRFVKTSSWFESVTDKIEELIGIPSYPCTPPGRAQLQLTLIKDVIVD